MKKMFLIVIMLFFVGIVDSAPRGLDPPECSIEYSNDIDEIVLNFEASIDANEYLLNSYEGTPVVVPGDIYNDSYIYLYPEWQELNKSDNRYQNTFMAGLCYYDEINRYEGTVVVGPGDKFNNII